MSYDYTIRKDDAFTGRTDLPSLRAFLHAQPGVRPGDSSFVVVDASGQECMVVYAEWVDAEGNSIDPDPRDPQALNCVRVTVPYAHLEAMGRRALDLSFRIAGHLGWRVYDEQEGEYLGGEDMRRALQRQEESRRTAERMLADLKLRAPRISLIRRLLPFLVAGAVVAAAALGVWIYLESRCRFDSIHRAAMEGGLEDVRCLLEKDPGQARARDEAGETPLHFAARRDDSYVVLTLIASGAEVDARAEDGSTPLHAAASHGSLRAARRLLVFGADPRARDGAGRTPIDLAREGNHEELVKVLTAPRSRPKPLRAAKRGVEGK